MSSRWTPTTSSHRAGSSDWPPFSTGNPDVAAAWGLDPELRPPRARPPQPTDARPVAGQPPRITFRSARSIGARPCSTRAAGSFPAADEDWDLWMSLAERGWTGNRHPGGDRALPRTERPAPVAIVRAPRRAHRRGCARAYPSLFASARAQPALPRRLPGCSRSTLPAIDALPLSPTRKTAPRRCDHPNVRTGTDLGTLVARYRAHRLLRAQRVLEDAPWCASPGLARPQT